MSPELRLFLLSSGAATGQPCAEGVMTGDRPSSQMFVGGRARLWDHWEEGAVLHVQAWYTSRGAPARLVGRQAAGVRVPRRGVRGGPALETVEAVRRARG